MERIDVLHVEDDDSWAGLVKVWLERRGLRVQRLRSHAELRSLLSAGTALPQCLLLDLMLKDGYGLTICDEIKGSPAFQHLPIVVLTGAAVSSRECLKHQAVYRVFKDESTEDELWAVMESVLRQQERSQGFVDAGDLRFDPHGHEVHRSGRLIARLTPGHFAGFLSLVRSSPLPMDDARLYASFLARHPYQNKPDPELTVRLIVRTYVSNLRRDLGDEVGSRIKRAHDDGYVYLPPAPRFG